MKKTLVAIGTLTALSGTAFVLGGVISEMTLSKKTVSSKPEDLLQCPGMLELYNKYPHFRQADNWYLSSKPEEKTVRNRNAKDIHYFVIPSEKPSHKWAICIHGYTSKPRRMSMQGKHYSDMGFNTVFPVLSAHLGDDRSHTSMGWFEKDDIVDLIKHIVATDSEAEILIHGCSMGAATTMLVTGEELPSNVKVAVEDCGYTSAWDEFHYNIREEKHLPAFPLLNFANAYSKLKLGWDFRKCSPLNAVSHSVTPTFFIHGKEDVFVPFSMEKQLFDACSSAKDYIEIPDAGHDMSIFIHPDMYWDAVDGFIEEYI